MVKSCFVECGEVLKGDFPKRFSMERFVPVLPVNGERVVVVILEKQAWARFPWMKIKLSPVLFRDPVADLINQALSLFAACLRLRELAIQDQFEGETAKRRRQPVT